MENLNDFERAAIALHVYTGCNDRKTLFKIAVGEIRYNKLKDTSLNTTVSNWYNSHKIQTAIKEFRIIQEQKENERLAEHLKELETESDKSDFKKIESQDINFLDPEQFLKHANEQANRIKDDKERRSWLEMIAKLMNYKEANDQETTEIKRFYIMKTCENCEIYQKCKGCNLSNCPK
jgi:hypothetical protein